MVAGNGTGGALGVRKRAPGGIAKVGWLPASYNMPKVYIYNIFIEYF